MVTRSPAISDGKTAGDKPGLFHNVFLSQALFETDVTGRVILSAEGMFVEANAAFCSMLGYSKAEILKKQVLSVTHEDDIDKSEQLFKTLLRGEVDELKLEKRYVRKDGVVIWAELHASAVRDDAGEVLFFIGQLQDITRRVALKEERDRMIDLSTDIICSAGLDGYFKMLNPAAHSILGYTLEELMAKPFVEFIHPDDREQTLKELEEHLAAGEQTINFENRYVCKDGTIKWLLWRAVPDVEKKMVYAVARDITAWKQVVIERDRLIEMSRDIICIVGFDGKVKMVNPSVETVLGYSVEEITGEPYMKLIHPEDVPMTEEAVVDALQGIETANFMNRSVCKDGSVKWFFWTGAMDFEQQVMYGIGRDITFLKQIESERVTQYEELERCVVQRTQDLEQTNQELLKAMEQLTEVNRSRDTFMSALTHDLRTPLIAQRRVFEHMMQNKESLLPEVSELTKQLLQSNQDVLDMVNKLLEIHQYESGKMNQLKEPVQLSALIHECVTNMDQLARDNGVAIHNQVTEQPLIEGDVLQLKRLFMNLLGNAVENLSSSCEVTVTAHVEDRSLLVQVSDNGPGIPKETLPYLFERYFVEATTRKRVGKGLGLYICRMILDLHDATIQVASELGEGTTFTMRFPLKELTD